MSNKALEQIAAGKRKQRKPAPPLEASIQASIIKWLKTVPDCEFEKRHGSGYGKSGQPDISGCIKGLRFEIELKRPGEEPRPDQRQRLAEWKAAGAVTGTAHSLKEFKTIIKEVQHKCSTIRG